MWRRDGDHHARPADVDSTDSVVDRNLAQLVAIREPSGEVGHDLLGHALVGLVFEVDDLSSAGMGTRRPDERRDRARAVVSDLRNRGVDGERLGREPEIAARDGRDDRYLVLGGQRLAALDVRAISRIEEPRRLVAEPELRPHVSHRGVVGQLQLEGAGAGSLAEPGEQPDANLHPSNGIRRLLHGP